MKLVIAATPDVALASIERLKQEHQVTVVTQPDRPAGRGKQLKATPISEIFPDALKPNSEEEFITEHYWGYTKLSDSKTSEYQVEHPRWNVYPIKNYSIDVDFGKVYGDDFGFISNEKPKSVFLAEGSEIKVLGGKKI